MNITLYNWKKKISQGKTEDHGKKNIPAWGKHNNRVNYCDIITTTEEDPH
jgi:hypothetical protein